MKQTEKNRWWCPGCRRKVRDQDVDLNLKHVSCGRRVQEPLVPFRARRLRPEARN